MGSTFSVVASLTGQRAASLGSCLVLGLTAGLVAGLQAGLSARPAAALFLSQLVLSPTHHRRVHFISLLEDAADRGVLQRAGRLYLLRHPFKPTSPRSTSHAHRVAPTPPNRRNPHPAAAAGPSDHDARHSRA
jgi:hypothetical protein